MYADGKAIVQMGNMSVRLSGLTREAVESLWSAGAAKNTESEENIGGTPMPRVLFDTPRITAFAIGKPSEAFGAPYTMFDPGEAAKNCASARAAVSVFGSDRIARRMCGICDEGGR